MGKSLLDEVTDKPATAVVTAVLVCTWFALNQRQLGYAEVGLSYDAVVRRGQIWRVVTAQLSHIELLHLIFNCSSLWSLAYLERGEWAHSQHGGLLYLGTSALLGLLSAAITIGVYHVLVVRLHREQFLHVTMVGYSAVVFGLMTLGALSVGGTFSVGGVLELPTSLAPLLSLIVTSLVVRRASFVGHVSGILSGAAISAGLFDWLNVWWSLSLAAWTMALAAWKAAESGLIRLPMLRISESGTDVEAGAVVSRHPQIAGT